jgi:hypothetical protein
LDTSVVGLASSCAVVSALPAGTQRPSPGRLHRS